MKIRKLYAMIFRKLHWSTKIQHFLVKVNEIVSDRFWCADYESGCEIVVSRQVFEIFNVWNIEIKGAKNEVFSHFQRLIKCLTIFFQHPAGCNIKVLFLPFKRIFDCYDPTFFHWKLLWKFVSEGFSGRWLRIWREIFKIQNGRSNITDRNLKISSIFIKINIRIFFEFLIMNFESTT